MMLGICAVCSSVPDIFGVKLAHLMYVVFNIVVSGKKSVHGMHCDDMK